MRPSNVSTEGDATNMPELKQSGHPLSGAAEKGASREKRWDSGWRARVSASRKMTRRNWISRKRWSLVRVEARSCRPVGMYVSVWAYIVWGNGVYAESKSVVMVFFEWW